MAEQLRGWCSAVMKGGFRESVSIAFTGRLSEWHAASQMDLVRHGVPEPMKVGEPKVNACLIVTP